MVAGALLGMWLVASNLGITAAWLWAVTKLFGYRAPFLATFDLSLLATIPLCVVTAAATPLVLRGGLDELTSATWIGALAVVALSIGVLGVAVLLHRGLGLPRLRTIGVAVVWAGIPATVSVLM